MVTSLMVMSDSSLLVAARLERADADPTVDGATFTTTWNDFDMALMRRVTPPKHGSVRRHSEPALLLAIVDHGTPACVAVDFNA